MSNPSINRWGVNLFWYHQWFNDKNYNLWLQQDLSILKIVYTFLNFGLFCQTNIFTSPYWIKRLKNFNYYNEFSTKYFRVMNFKNILTKEVSQYNERLRVENLFQSRLWILKFQDWIVINFYSYSPIKKRRKKKFYKKLDVDSVLGARQNGLKGLKRTKLLLLYFFKKVNSRGVYYRF